MIIVPAQTSVRNTQHPGTGVHQDISTKVTSFIVNTVNYIL